MPAVAPITLVDRESPATNHEFVPAGQLDDNTWKFVETSGVPIGDSIFSTNLRVLSNGNRKVVLRLTVPVLVDEIINGVSRSKVERTAQVRCEFTFAANSTAQERKNVAGMLQSALFTSQTELNPHITNLEPLY